MTPVLHIEATGMCCAVGHSVPAAAAAMGACVDHFRQSWFRGRDGKPLSCAMIWGLDTWGPERMGDMFSCVLDECRAQVPLNPATTALLLLVPDASRPGADAAWPQDIYRQCTGDLHFHPASRICPWDRAGIGTALLHARSLLTAKTVERVLLAGVDSYLVSATITALLAADRLLSTQVSDGFIPGEGAGAVVLRLGTAESRGLRVSGVGTGYEAAHILQHETPNRAHGLVEAIRAAVKESGQPLTNIDFHMNDNNGNTYYSTESTIAMMRTLEHRVPGYPYLLPASYYGETGAAAGPLMLAALTRIMPENGYSHGLVHCSADNGHRAAVIVDYSPDR